MRKTLLFFILFFFFSRIAPSLVGPFICQEQPRSVHFPFMIWRGGKDPFFLPFLFLYQFYQHPEIRAFCHHEHGLVLFFPG